MTCGIYLLGNDSTGKVYIGQSTNIEGRIKEHLRKLSNGTHINKEFSKDYIDNPGAFSWIVIDRCSPESLDNLEINWIEEFDSVNLGYNITKGGANGTPFFYSNSKYTEQEILEVLRLLSLGTHTIEEVSKVTGVGSSMVEHIKYADRHPYLKEIYPEYYAKIPARKALKKSDRIFNYITNTSSGETVEVVSCKEVAIKYGLDPGHISKVLHGKRKEHRGWIGT